MILQNAVLLNGNNAKCLSLSHLCQNEHIMISHVLKSKTKIIKFHMSRKALSMTKSCMLTYSRAIMLIAQNSNCLEIIFNF